MTARWLTAFVVLATSALHTLVADGAAGSGAGPRGLVRVAGKPAAHAVVWLEGVETPGPSPGRVVLDQRALAFLPHVLAVRAGTAVEMPNHDRVFHNVFSFKDGKKFDLGLYPAGDSKVVTFDRPGVSRIFCNIHPHMAAYVVAVDSAHFGVSDDKGRFTLPPVGPGTYTFHAWIAGRDIATGQLTVAPDRLLEVTLP